MSELDHYRYIDALRGFAFLGVMAVHVNPIPNSPLGIIGQNGVQLFFVLSSVTLMRSIAQRSSKEHFPTRNFFIRRFFRIVPLFWSAIAFYCLIDRFRPRYWAPNGIGSWELMSTVFFLHGLTPTSINSVVPGGWSIAVEMTFYLCLPILAAQLTTMWSTMAFAFGVLVASAILHLVLAPVLTHCLPSNEHYLIPEFFYFWFPSQLPVFLMGIATYYYLQSASFTRMLSEPKRPALLAATAIYGLSSLSTMNGGLLIPTHLLYTLFLIMIILALAARPYPIAVNRFTCGLGKISFSCYITHFAAIRVMVHLISLDYFAFVSPVWSQILYAAVVWLGTLTLTIMISVLSYRFIEKPGIELGKFIIRAIEGEPKVI